MDFPWWVVGVLVFVVIMVASLVVIIYRLESQDEF